jgi:predicted metal-dependent hydrolase
MRARQPAQALVLREGAQVPVLGQPLHLHIETTPRARPQVTHSDGGLLLAVRSAADVPAVFARWFTQSAQADFAARLAVWEPRAAALGIAGHTALTVRAMKTRWGTCTHTGRITLNRALYHLEPALIDYVVAHELCHRREMNHSARYYLLLDALMPGWPAHRAALRALQPLAWA